MARNKSQFNVEQFRSEAVKPLYAVAGATELAFDRARDYATEAQKTVQGRVSRVQRRNLLNGGLEDLTKEAREAQATFEARIAELQKDARAFPGRVQAQITEAVSELTETYAELAARGEAFVAAIRKDGVKAVTALKKAPNHSTVARRENAIKGAENRKPARKSPAKKAPATRTASKSTASKTSASKSTASKRTTASKTTTAKKSTPSSSSTSTTTSTTTKASA